MCSGSTGGCGPPSPSSILGQGLALLFFRAESPRMRKQVLLLAELAISLAIIAAVLYLVDVGKVIEAIASANPFFLIAAFTAYFGINLGMSTRIRVILAEMGHRVAAAPALMANFAGMLVSDFTPARSGYFATAFALTANEKIPLNRSIVSILGPQMFDFMVKVGAGGIAIIYIFYRLNLGEGSLAGMLLGVIGLSAMLVFGVLLLFSKRFLAMLGAIERLPFGKKVYGELAVMQKNAAAIKRVIWAILVLMAVTWTLKGIEWWFLAMSIGMEPQIDFHPLVFYMFLQPLITMLQFIPTPSLAGMGVSEAGSVAVLALFGVPAHIAVAFAIMTRSLMIILDLVGVNEARRVVRKNLDKIFEGKMAGWDE